MPERAIVFDGASSAVVALEKFLKKPTGPIICKLITGGMDEGPVVKCLHSNITYIVKLFQNTAAGKNEALWTELASRLGIGPKVYYADPVGTYLIMEFVEGVSLTPKITANPLILQNIAKNVALLHRQTVSFEQSLDIFSRIENKYKALQTSGSLQHLLASLWQYIETLKESIYAVPVVLAPCHNDLNPRNIFVHNNQVTTIDWGDASINIPYYDIVAFFVLNSLTQEQEVMFLTEYDALLLERHWQLYLSMLKQVVRFEFALNLLLGVQKFKKDLLAATQLPQTKSLQQYLTLFAEQQVPTDASFKYAMGLASLSEVRNKD